MMPLLALLLQLQAAPPEPDVAPRTQGTTRTVDPIGDWLASEGDLKAGSAEAMGRAYRRYRSAGGTASYTTWRQAVARGTLSTGDPPLGPSARRECLEGRQVRISERYDTWFRTASPDDRLLLPHCYPGRRDKAR